MSEAMGSQPTIPVYADAHMVPPQVNLFDESHDDGGRARFTFSNPDDILWSWSNEQLLDLTCLLLAGRAAEEVGGPKCRPT
jgi:hypothetical protein